MAERYYVNSPLGPGPVVLQGAEAHHLTAVSRLRPGAVVFLFNGDGREYRAEVVAVGRREAQLTVLDSSAPSRELPFALTVACPLPKGDRAQFLIEKLTELGAATYVPLRTQRSIVHPREGRTDKLQRYVIEASKQCGRNILMAIRELTSWTDFAQQPDLPPRKLLAHPGGAALPAPAPVDTVLAVGPEGGFTAEEAQYAHTAGWQVVSLGPRTLRVETAAIALTAHSALGVHG
jgi:16S rRNA (uracil1498-N3)-methyltransferase